ncbi:unnamed protein product [Ixodes pacificus]
MRLRLARLDHSPPQREQSFRLLDVPCQGDSALKLQVRLDNINRSYRNERLEIEALTKLTYTTKHRWYPKNEKYKDPNPPVDREGL